jgi:hypothetical protein
MSKTKHEQRSTTTSVVVIIVSRQKNRVDEITSAEAVLHLTEPNLVARVGGLLQ